MIPRLISHCTVPAVLIGLACGGDRDAIPAQPTLALGAPVVAVGLLHGTNAEMFGEIADVVAAPGGDFFVLDAGRQEIKRYDAAGTLRDRVGRAGSEPGEFRAAANLAITADGHLIVVDEATWDLTVYRVEPQAIAYRHASRLPFLPRGVCAVRNRIYVLAFHESRALHEVSLTGTVLHSFAKIPDVVDPDIAGSAQTALREQFASGHLACLSVGRYGVIAHVPELYPMVRAYTAAGDPLWKVPIRGYHALQRTSGDGETVRLRPDPSIMRAHRAIGLSPLDPSSFVLQLLERDYEREQIVGVESRRVYVVTGKTVTLRDTLPRLSMAMEGRVYAWRPDPFPQVLVFDRPRETDEGDRD